MKDNKTAIITMIIFYIIAATCWAGIAVINSTIGLDSGVKAMIFLLVVSAVAFWFGLVSSLFIGYYPE
jgi:hypothetical protein